MVAVSEFVIYPTLAFGFSDVGGGEILVVGIIALLLFGKNLPRQARNLGRAIAEFKRTINQASDEIHREIDAAATDVEESTKDVAQDIAKDNPVSGVEEAVRSGMEQPAATQSVADTAPPPGTPVTSSEPRESASSAAQPSADSGPAPQTATAVSSAAALDDLVRNLPPPSKVPPPVM